MENSTDRGLGTSEKCLEFNNISPGLFPLSSFYSGILRRHNRPLYRYIREKSNLNSARYKLLSVLPRPLHHRKKILVAVNGTGNFVKKLRTPSPLPRVNHFSYLIRTTDFAKNHTYTQKNLKKITDHLSYGRIGRDVYERKNRTKVTRLASDLTMSVNAFCE